MCIKEKWLRLGNFLKLSDRISWKDIATVYALFLVPFYLFAFLVRKDMMEWDLLLPLLLILLMHLELAFGSYFKPQSADSIKEYINSTKELVGNRDSLFKIRYKDFIIPIIMYLLSFFLIFITVPILYNGTISTPLIIFFLILTIIRISLMYNLADTLSLSKYKRNNILVFFLSPIIIDLVITVARYIRQNYPIVSYSTKLYETLSILPISYLEYAVIIVGVLFQLFFFMKPAIKTDVGEGSFRRNFSMLILSLLLFMCLAFASYSSPSSQDVIPRFSYIQTFILIREFVILVFALTFFSQFLSGVKELTNKNSVDGKYIIKKRGTVKGFAFYVHESSILLNLFYRKRYRFLVLDSNGKIIKVLLPKRNLIFSGEDFYPGEEVEFYGYSMYSEDISPSKENRISHFVPLVFRMVKISKLRKIL